jgi:hypothetical protein
MKSYFKQHEVSSSTQRFKGWQAWRAVWRRFVTFMYDKWGYSRYRSGLASDNHESDTHQEQRGLVDPAAYVSSLEAERQRLEEIYRNS